jgi:hypothetical protein
MYASFYMPGKFQRTKYLNLKSEIKAWCQWLTPVILATQEAEIRRIMV